MSSQFSQGGDDFIGSLDWTDNNDLDSIRNESNRLENESRKLRDQLKELERRHSDQRRLQKEAEEAESRKKQEDERRAREQREIENRDRIRREEEERRAREAREKDDRDRIRREEEERRAREVREKEERDRIRDRSPVRPRLNSFDVNGRRYSQDQEDGEIREVGRYTAMNQATLLAKIEALEKKLENIERDLVVQERISSKRCLIFSGSCIPRSPQDPSKEDLFLEMRKLIEKKYGAYLYYSEIAAVHRISGGKVIIEFSQRSKNSTFQNILLKEPLDLRMPLKAEVRLCSHDRMLQDAAQKLKREKRIDMFFVDHISGKICVKKNQKKTVIGSLNDLKNL